MVARRVERELKYPLGRGRGSHKTEQEVAGTRVLFVAVSQVIMDAEQRKIARDDEKKLEQAAKRNKVAEQPDESGAADTPARREKKVYANPMRARRIRLYPTKEQEDGRFFGVLHRSLELLKSR